VNCTHSEEPSAGCYPTSDNSTAYDSKMVDFRIENQTNPTPGDFSDDIPIGYTISVFDTYTDHKIVFARGWPSTFEFISTRVTSDGTSFIVDPVANCLHVTLSGLYNHDLPEDSRTNPRVTINSTIFFTQVSAN